MTAYRSEYRAQPEIFDGKESRQALEDRAARLETYLDHARRHGREAYNVAYGKDGFVRDALALKYSDNQVIQDCFCEGWDDACQEDHA